MLFAVRRVGLGMLAAAIVSPAFAIYGRGNLDASGFTLAGTLGGGSGVVIGDGWVATAKHVGGTQFNLNGTNFNALERYDNPDADLALLRFAPGTFVGGYRPYFGNVVGETLTYVGYGWTASYRESGDPFPFTGYNVDTTQARRRMTNRAGRVAFESSLGFTIQADLDTHDPRTPAANQVDSLGDGAATAEEGGLLPGDSGSAALLQVGGEWRLVGINVAVEDRVGPDHGSGSWNNYTDFGDVFHSTSLANYQQWIETTTVPEPATAVVLGLGAIAFLRRRKARTR